MAAATADTMSKDFVSKLNVSSQTDHLDRVKQILQANRQTKRTIQDLTNDFMNVQLDLMNELQHVPQTGLEENNNGLASSADAIASSDFEFLENSLAFDNVQLAVCGPNSSGKTSFLQIFLKIGDILPTKVGPVSARIVKLTYAPAEGACLLVYQTIKAGLSSEEQAKEHISLADFFQRQQKVDWTGVRKAINKHVARPADLTEEQFSDWVRNFVEIRIPSPTLELGIDAYDTPGFLFYDKPTVKENLHELVKLVRPTLIFMYENSAVAGDAHECFLALKTALGNLEHPHIFFLNTKQDIMTLFSDAGISATQQDLFNPTKFSEILPREREKRFRLLLNVPAMTNELHSATSAKECDCFDICSKAMPGSVLPACATEMTERTIQRIIQFVVKTNLEESYHMADSLLNMIDSFFEFSLTTSRRDPSQWAKIRHDAKMWGETFFEKFAEQLAALIASAYTNILQHFDERSAQISKRAAKLDRLDDPLESRTPQITKRGVKEFIKIAVQEEVIKVAVNQIINKTKETLRQSITCELASNVNKNELLISAQRRVLVDISATELEQRRWFERLIFNLTVLPMKVSRLVKGLRIKWDVDFWNKRKVQEFDDQENYYAYSDALDTYANLIDPTKRKDFADTYMTKMRIKLTEQEKLFERNLKEWMETKKKIFFQKIESDYQLAIKRLSARKTAYEIANLYAGQFARIECKLIAAKDLAQFNGQIPIIDSSKSLGEGAFFTVHAAEWDDKKDLVVKKLKRPSIEYPYLQYLEAHYHRKITKLDIPHVAPLLFLYDHPWSDDIFAGAGNFNSDLWIFLPKYKQSLTDYLEKNIRTITSDTIIKIALDIANVLVELHSNEIVHRDVKSKNILMDNNEKCYLADFGTCKESTTNYTILGTLPIAPELLFSIRHEPSITYDGTAVDIYSFGILLYELLPKLSYHRPHTDKTDLNVHELLKSVQPLDMNNNNEYELLIKSCLKNTAKQRPTALAVVKKLEEIKKTFEQKSCTICENRIRKCRFYPCGHKLLCEDCYNQLQNNEEGKIECILCRRSVDRWNEDDENQTFYLRA
ncbi:unnamed protein product [Didymodactylos carnosus]|uniref:Protein kinase domain-containing protein n=1 Tax=Didymodactylos carnosus TaxID=1234261 RepID=A0A8S2DLR2_9BILA|nr:unnamed protein product [Didymodactylos carnosus]CAF3699925.1 unnamed protein product [Didymodactylos carnosus]